MTWVLLSLLELHSTGRRGTIDLATFLVGLCQWHRSGRLALPSVPLGIQTSFFTRGLPIVTLKNHQQHRNQISGGSPPCRVLVPSLGRRRPLRSHSQSLSCTIHSVRYIREVVAPSATSAVKRLERTMF